jgi:hypothetical protein
MLKKLATAMQSLVREAMPVDPSQFGDPVAERTEWTPLKRGGTNFRTHKLVRVDARRMAFRATFGAQFFYLLFIGMGVVVPGIILGSMWSAGQREWIMLMPAGMGALFAIVGSYLLVSGNRPIVFDRRQGYFWVGRQEPNQVFDVAEIKQLAALDVVHALQLIREYVRGNKSSYYSYELNLVLANGERVPVVDHGSVKRLRDDAATLAAFLEKPVWDAT